MHTRHAFAIASALLTLAAWNTDAAAQTQGSSQGTAPSSRQVTPEQTTPGQTDQTGAGSQGSAASGIYGEQLMTPEEKQEYQQRIGQAGTAEERTHLEGIHRKMMQQRAAERGVTLPDMDKSTTPMAP
jgi:hypothetical protein